MKKALQPDEFDPASDEATDAAIDKMLLLARQRLARAIAPIRRSVARVGIIESPLGRLLAAESPRGLVALTYLDTRDGGHGAGGLEAEIRPASKTPRRPRGSAAKSNGIWPATTMRSCIGRST